MEGTLEGADRTLRILSLFLEPGADELGVTEIARRLELSKSVVHRSLASLCANDFVEQHERRYRLGIRALQVGMRYLERLDGVELARSSLPSLVAATDETATVSVRSGSYRIYVAQHLPQRSIRMTVQLGLSYPLHAGASSKVLLAFAPFVEREAHLGRVLVPVTPNTITSPSRLRVELDAIRARGLAISFGERQLDAAAVAAPILDGRGTPVCSISVCGPIERFRDQATSCAAVLRDVARDVSSRLGYRGPVFGAR